jgi:hypothetical protein
MPTGERSRSGAGGARDASFTSESHMRLEKGGFILAAAINPPFIRRDRTVL